MSLPPTDYALLSQAAYKDPEIDTSDPSGLRYKIVELDGHKYRPIAHTDNQKTGFQATAYERLDSSHEVVIAYRGTEFDREARQDGLADAAMALNNVNPQIPGAMAFTGKVMDLAKTNADLGHYPLNVSVTGHSLGGTLAEVAAYEYKLHGATFNAYGAVGLVPGISEGGSQVIDYVRATDVVSAASGHFGEVRVYATQQDIDALQRSGYHDNGLLNAVTPHVPILGGIQGDAHAIDNFVPDSKLLGHSIVSVENEKRAEAHGSMISTYRNEIALARDVAFVGYQTQKPFIAGAELALDAGKYAEQKVEQAYDATRTTVIRGTEAAERLAQRGYEAARTEVASGARAVKHGAHVVAEHVEQTYDSAREAASRGAHEVEQAARDAATRARGVIDSLSHPGSWFDSKPAPSVPKPIQLDDPAHPGHAMFLQSRGGVHHIDAKFQRAPDEKSENLAGALAVKAHTEGMTRVDQVALSEDGARAFAVQKGMPMQTAHVQTSDAVQTSLAQSSLAWQQVDRHTDKAMPLQQAALPSVQAPQHELG